MALFVIILNNCFRKRRNPKQIMDHHADADCKVEAKMILITPTDASLMSPVISCVIYI